MADTITTSDEVQTGGSESIVEPPESAPAVKNYEVPVHPHFEEILKGPNDWQLQKEDPVPYKSLEEIPYSFIDSKEDLNNMIAKLKTEREIAVSVKGSNRRCFRKKNCLIQIATHSEVFLVDTIALKDDIKALNDVFTERDVLKVGHTRDAYIRDFQKDLGLYVVNMFCLPVADEILSRANLESSKGGSYSSLKNLLKEHCDVDYTDYFKELQDWQERPLPVDYINCARTSVQYLLHIYNKFRNMLIERDLLLKVYEECNKFCQATWKPSKNARKHSKALYAHLSLYRRMGDKWQGDKERQLNKMQIEVFKVVHGWRQTTAEKHDEGYEYLLTDQAIYDIAKALPKDVEGIKDCLLPDTPCSLLEENLGHISELIVKEINAVSGTGKANEMVPFNQNQLNNMYKGRHFSPQFKNQTYSKKNRMQQHSNYHPYYRGQDTQHFGYPTYPMNPDMGRPVGYMDPSMGYMDPSMGYMDPSGYMDSSTGYMNHSTGYMDPSTGYMDPSTGYSGMPMGMPHKPYGW